jgi:predicted trehalose synthase
MRLIRKLSEDIARVHAALASEKQAREETEEALVKMMEEVFGRLQGELEQEKAARKETEATLVRLLEDTCVKVSAAPQSVI